MRRRNGRHQENQSERSITDHTDGDGRTCQRRIIQALEEFHDHDMTPNLLWDFSDADLSAITQVRMEQIIAISKANAHLRWNGRTALVVKRDLSFGLSPMYGTLADISGHPVAYRVFRDKDKAIDWLGTGE